MRCGANAIGRQVEMGIVQEKWGITPRDPRVPLWELASYKDWEMRCRVKRMAGAYADWEKQVGVQPWPMPETPQNQRQGTMPSPEYLRKDRL